MHELTQPAGCYKLNSNQLIAIGGGPGVPDRIERTVQLACPPERVRVALTAEGLGPPGSARRHPTSAPTRPGAGSHRWRTRIRHLTGERPT
jgi:hypothetical protein